MNKSIAMAVLSAAGLATAAFAQAGPDNPAGYTYEFRIIADGDAGAPSGTWAQRPLSSTATQIGFWIQARVMQTVNENWGIVRVSPPAAPATSFLTLSNSAGAGTLQRGAINAGGTQHGRGLGYRTGGLNVGATGNAAGSAAFPGVAGNENGAIDSGGTRIYSFDSYVDGQRADTDFDMDGDADDDGDGMPENPWRVNGAGSNGATSGSPVPSGQFSPWANIYRFMVIPTDVNTQRTITLNAFAQIQGAVQAAPTSVGGSSFAMQVGPGRLMSAEYSFTWGIPTPGAAALMGMGMLAAARRRR